MKTVRIGGASAYFSDSVTAVSQLLTADPCPDYLMFDFMSEGTIGMTARALAADPNGGFMRDLVDIHLADNLDEIAARGVKIIANAGGMNPKGCAAAVEALLDARGVKLKVAYVEGDDLRGQAEALRAAGSMEMFSGAPFPSKVDSINAYLGAFPIAQALSQGADIVVTGRCADSALGLGPLIREFGWTATDWDKLAGGTLVGHLLECGCQVTGGTFTDWEDVPDWAGIGYPIADVTADGACVLSKPPQTGGLISVGSVAEQLLYEVSDPQAYIVADVVCDFSQVRLEQVGENRVAVSGARGYPATDSYKAVASYHAGWRGTYQQLIIGMDAGRKAQRMGEDLIQRGRRLLRARNLADYSRTDVLLLGGEASYGDRARVNAPREVIYQASVDHEEKVGVDLFCREARAALSAFAPGATALTSATAIPISKLHLFLVPKAQVAVTVTVDGRTIPSPQHLGAPFDPATIERPPAPAAPSTSQDPLVEAPLVQLAWGRSGDKGNLFNVAVIARRPEFLPYIRAALTPARVGEWYAHLGAGGPPKVTAYDVPGFLAVNFVVHDSLDGGLLVSPRADGAAKGMAQQLLEIPVRVPERLLA